MPSHFMTSHTGATAEAERWRRLDALALGFAILWMAEALVRLQAGPALAAPVYAWFLVRFAMTAPAFLNHIARCWWMLPFPAVALISVTWSMSPQHSLVSALQVGFTLALAAYASGQFGFRPLCRIVALALGVAMALSAINLLAVWPPTHSWEGGFLGVFTNKNALGQRAALLLVLCTYLVVGTIPVLARAGWIGLGAGAAGLLVLSASATGIMLGLAAAAAVLAGAIWRQSRTRAVALIFGLTVASAGLAVVVAMNINPAAEALAYFGKNSTLTGRTMLWQIAWGKIQDAPILGTGYMAYWSAPQSQQEVRLIAELYGSTVASFHNFILETAVVMGIPGVLAMGVLVAGAVMSVFRAGAAAGDRYVALILLGLLLTLSLLGSSLYRQHEITIFLLPALGAGLARSVGEWRGRPVFQTP